MWGMKLNHAFYGHRRLRSDLTAFAQPVIPIQNYRYFWCFSMPYLVQRTLMLSKLLFLPLLLVFSQAHAIEEGDLLPVEEAYIPTVTVIDDVATLNFKVVPGYYLYKERISLEAARPAEVVMGPLEMPAGEEKTDEFFGKMHVFHKDFTGTSKLTFPSARPVLVAFRLKYQGCADIGVCYPPQTRTFAMDLGGEAARNALAQSENVSDPGMISGITDPASAVPMMDAAPGLPADPLGLVPSSSGPGLIAQADALPEAQAFRAEALATDGQTVLVRISALSDYYLYRDQFKFVLRSDGATATPMFPASQLIKDEHFGDVEVYFGGVDIPLKLTRTSAVPANATLEMEFQGCKKDSVCYPVMHRSIALALPSATSNSADMTTPTIAPLEALPVGVVAPLSTAAADAAPIREANAEVLPQLLTPSIVIEAIARATGAGNSGGAVQKTPADSANVGLFWALLLALAGGALLNLMPCVLPVLSLKVLGLVESGASAKTAKTQAIWYTIGVLASFFLLGLILLSFKSAGAALGWGFQLQNPLIVGLLAFLLIAMGLNLSGVVSFGHSFGNVGANFGNSTSPARNAFFNGVLACIVATPCTGPGMFTALGYGFTQSNFVAMLVLLALGLGLALPFLLIGFIPALAQRLPKPGAWMDTLKSWLAFPLYITAVWLLSVLGNQTGITGMSYALAGAVVLAAGLWWWDKQRYSTADSTILGKTFSLALIFGALAILFSATKLKNDAHTELAEGQVAYSPAALAKLRAAGTPVFVDMTAAWCITCKVNEKNAINTYAVGQAMQQAGMVYMVGDYTNGDAAITDYLKSFGAVGVPLYVMYPKGVPANRAP